MLSLEICQTSTVKDSGVTPSAKSQSLGNQLAIKSSNRFIEARLFPTNSNFQLYAYYSECHCY
jgi:hypothetical protein